MSNNDEQKVGEAEVPGQCSPPHQLADPSMIGKTLIAKLTDKSDGPPQCRMKRKTFQKKNNSGQASSESSSSATSNAPRPFEKSNFLYEKKSKKKYKQEKEDWWRDDDVQREKRSPDTEHK